MTYIRSVTVEHIKSGQPRAYADSIYEAYLTFSVPEGQLWASKFAHDELLDYVVKPYIMLMVHDFYDGPNKQWHQPWLEKLEYLGEGKWHVVVISPYLD